MFITWEPMDRLQGRKLPSEAICEEDERLNVKKCGRMVSTAGIYRSSPHNMYYESRQMGFCCLCCTDEFINPRSAAKQQPCVCLWAFDRERWSWDTLFPASIKQTRGWGSEDTPFISRWTSPLKEDVGLFSPISYDLEAFTKDSLLVLA